MKFIFLIMLMIQTASCVSQNKVYGNSNKEVFLGRVLSKEKPEPEKIKHIIEQQKSENIQDSLFGIIMIFATRGASIPIPVQFLSEDFIEYKVSYGIDSSRLVYINDSSFEVGNCVQIYLNNSLEKETYQMRLETTNKCKDL